MRQAGQVLRGTLRINPHNRSEAYVTIEGLPLDILIDGSSAQNRSVSLCLEFHNLRIRLLDYWNT